jgi:hypothetical protein
MAWNFLSKLAAVPVKEVAGQIGKAAGSIMNRIGFTEKLSEEKRIDKYSTLIGISEASTDSARQMFMTELSTQKQPWLIRILNGLVRPVGGLGALATEFYAIWGANLGSWFKFKFIPITITTEQHLVLGAIIAFYFGSRLKETLTGVSTKR